MKLLIHFIEESDSDMVAACIDHIKRFYGGSEPPHPVEVWCNKPDRDGMTEYIMRLPYCCSPTHLTIGAIRRGPGQKVEFHS